MVTDIKEVLKTYEDYLRISTNSSPLTVQKYMSTVRKYLLDTAVAHTDIQKMNEWISNNNRVKSTYAYKYALKHLLLCYGDKQGAIDLVSPKKRPRKKIFNFVAKGTMQNVLNALPGIYRKLAFMQIKTGVRFQEAATIRAENIDFEISPTLIYITIGVNKSLTKGSKERKIRLSKKYASLIASWMPRKFGYLFLDTKCEHMSQEELYIHLDTMRRYYDRELEKAGRMYGAESLSSHYLRHLFADYFLNSGGDPIYLQQVLGHKKLDTTMGYVSIADKRADEALLKMEEN
jgi:integrase